MSFLSSLVLTKLGAAVNMFGDYVCVNYANILCPSGYNQSIYTKFTRPIGKMSKATPHSSRILPLIVLFSRFHPPSSFVLVRIAPFPFLSLSLSLFLLPSVFGNLSFPSSSVPPPP